MLLSLPLLTNKVKVPEPDEVCEISHLKLFAVPFDKEPEASSDPELLATTPSVNDLIVKATWFTISVAVNKSVTVAVAATPPMNVSLIVIASLTANPEPAVVIVTLSITVGAETTTVANAPVPVNEPVKGTLI